MKVKATAEQLTDGRNGGCTACGEVQEGGVEPDATSYECENCGKHSVSGLDLLLLIGQIELVTGFEDADEGSEADDFN